MLPTFGLAITVGSTFIVTQPSERVKLTVNSFAGFVCPISETARKRDSVPEQTKSWGGKESCAFSRLSGR